MMSSVYRYRCETLGMPVTLTCGPGELFNPEIGACDEAANVDCPNPDDFDGECEERHVGNFYPHPESMFYLIH